MLPAAHSLADPSPVPWRAWVELGRIRHLQWSPYTLAVPGLPTRLNGLRIVHITDLHITPTWMPAWDILHARLAANPPDLILISGDFIEHKHDCEPSLPNVRRFVDGLRCTLGVYGTLGNHDGDVLPVFTGDWPVRLLCNESIALRDGDTAIEIFGFHGVERTDLSPRVIAAILPKSPGTLRLGMAHYPSQIEPLAGRGFDVLCSGHTHGGQVCLPGQWPLLTHDTLPRRMARGVHRVGDQWLVIGRGLGFSTYPIRTFCPAEAIEITLVPERRPI